MAIKKRSKQSNSAEIIASSDIVTEILIRLPLKKLIQSKIVSKQWFSFVRNPGFDRLRDSHQIHTAIRQFASCTDFKSIRYVDFFPIPIRKSTVISPQRKTLNLSQDPNGTRILQSCYGLLLCSNFRVNENCWSYYVFNPEINEFSIIRGPDGEIEGWFGVLGVSLAFDPSKSPHYQLVCVVRLNCIGSTQNVLQIYIYCSETSVWRKSGEPFSEQINYEDGVYWNGAVHWIDRGGEDLLCYNIEDHVFKEMPSVPYFIISGQSYCYLGKSRDRLNLFVISEPRYYLDIYQMKRDYSAWYIRNRVRLLYMFDAYTEMIKPGPDIYPFRVLSVVRCEKDEDTFLVLGTPGKVVRCNIYSQLIREGG